MCRYGSVISVVMILISFLGFSQNELDSIETDYFRNDVTEAFINKNLEKLEKLIVFPLDGDWGFMMGVEKEESDWTKEDFYLYYENLFNEEVIKALGDTSYLELRIDEGTVSFSVSWETKDGFEKAAYFIFAKHDELWKLVKIYGAG